MAIPVRNTGGDFEVAPAGVYVARCYQMVDIGTQQQSYQGQAPKPTPKVIIWWELLTDDDGKDIRMADGRPFSISKEYTNSLHKKATLRKDLDSWRGTPFKEEEAKDFDLAKLLGKHCKLQIVHKESSDGERTYANLQSIMTTTKTPEGVNSIVEYSVLDHKPEVFDALPEWVQKKINESTERGGGTTVKEGNIDDSGQVEIEDLDEEPVDVSSVPF